MNYSRNDERRFLVDLGVAYGTDLAAAQALALETVNGLPFVLEQPAPSVWVEQLGDSTVVLRVAAWIAQHETSILLARSEAQRLCLIAFDAAGISMPEPTFRIIGSAGAIQTPAPAEPARPARLMAAPEPVDLEAQGVAATADAELERIVDAERREQSDGDLLNRAAPEE